MAFGGPPRRHGRMQLEKLVRLDPGKGPGARFERIWPLLRQDSRGAAEEKLQDDLLRHGPPGPVFSDGPPKSVSQQCNAIQYYTIQRNATQRHNAIQCNALLHNTTQYNAKSPHRVHKGMRICTPLSRTVYVQPRSSYCLRAAQEFVPFTCNPEVRTQRQRVNGATFWVARKRYKTKGSMVLLGLFSAMGLPDPFRNNARQDKTIQCNATQRHNTIQCNTMLYNTSRYNAM